MMRPAGHRTMQRSSHSGHKRMHCLVYQIIVTPDSFIFCFHGPRDGRRHVLKHFWENEMEEKLSAALLIDGVQYDVYGGSAYIMRSYMIRHFDRMIDTPDKKAINTAITQL